MKRKSNLCLFLTTAIFIVSLSACSVQSNKIHILDAKIAKAVNEKLLPMDATKSFPSGTSKVYLWFKWSNAEINTAILASWHYVTDDIHILDYSFNIPRKEGAGSVSLTMPESKILPAGTYRVDLKKGSQTLKSLTFTVLEKN